MHVVDRWLTMCPIPIVEALVADTELSLRQVERNCKALYGKSPKALARKFRALRAAAAMRSDPEASTDVIEYGYYDQSHMIHEVKHFTGMTPGQIRSAKLCACPTNVCASKASGRSRLTGTVKRTDVGI